MPPRVDNAIVRFYSMLHGAVARYSCLPGFESDAGSQLQDPLMEAKRILSHNAVKCIRGDWTFLGVEPVCKPLYCATPKLKPGVLANYEEGYELSEANKQVPHNQIIVFSCANSAINRIKGPELSICLSGLWTPSETPSCEPILHDLFEWPLDINS
ncbi:hypothetical protein Ciccas_008962 [Cichlidogyrus casuarinus]|uniref:Sushi domain-containing protein n=1 Tax=Cichlidogyrus casuarinus TaxID=1844966 RepID=A0ABD2Q157_9PLAT